MIFDLWGTLVDELRYPEANRVVYQQKVHKSADLLGVERDGFARSWAAGSAGRMVGAFPSIEAALMDISGGWELSRTKSVSRPLPQYGSNTYGMPWRPVPAQSKRCRR